MFTERILFLVAHANATPDLKDHCMKCKRIYFAEILIFSYWFIFIVAIKSALKASTVSIVPMIALVSTMEHVIILMENAAASLVGQVTFAISTAAQLADGVQIVKMNVPALMAESATRSRESVIGICLIFSLFSLLIQNFQLIFHN